MPSRNTSGFTLMELLVVMAILMILMTASVVAISSFAKATRLTNAGQQLSASANVARQNSMSRNAMTALVILDDPDHADNRRAFTLLELVSPADGTPATSSSWKQITAWQTLPTGIFVTFPEEFSNPLDLPFASYPSVKPDPEFPVLQYQGQEVQSFRYISFLPLGGLKQSKSAALRIAEGYLSSDSKLIFTHPNAEGNPANYFDISVLSATGRTKIDRP